MANLEQRLGELTGELRALGPVLERVEGRVTEDQKEISSLKTEIQTIKLEINEIKDQLKENDKEDKDNSKGTKNHFIDIAKLIFAATLGGIITYVIDRVTK